MTGGTYGYLHYPWKAAVDLKSPQPARFYTALIGQAMRYIIPTGRRFGSVWGLAARRGLPERTIARALSGLPRRPRPDLDELVRAVHDAWPRFAEEGIRVPPAPDELSVLALERSAGPTVFVFGSEARPLIVLKTAGGEEAGIEREVAALREAAPTGLGPRYLGRLGEARVQEGIDGAALRVEPLAPDRAGALRWTEPLAELAGGFVKLAETTAKSGKPRAFGTPPARAMEDAALSSRAQRSLAAAWRDVSRLDISSLGHGDCSPQNCLFLDGRRLSGLVDWERATPLGVPGFDSWTASLSYVMLGVGLARWSQRAAVDTFAAAWHGSPFFGEARAAARRAAVAAGYPERCLDALEVAFFGIRLERRLQNPGGYPTTAWTAARMLELVCAQ